MVILVVMEYSQKKKKDQYFLLDNFGFTEIPLCTGKNGLILNSQASPMIICGIFLSGHMEISCRKVTRTSSFSPYEEE